MKNVSKNNMLKLIGSAVRSKYATEKNMWEEGEASIRENIVGKNTSAMNWLTVERAKHGCDRRRILITYYIWQLYVGFPVWPIKYHVSLRGRDVKSDTSSCQLLFPVNK